MKEIEVIEKTELTPLDFRGEPIYLTRIQVYLIHKALMETYKMQENEIYLDEYKYLFEKIRPVGMSKFRKSSIKF